jgi:hypothetical protein
MESIASRRHFISGLTLLAVGDLMPPALAKAEAAATQVNPHLRRLIALHDRAQAESERFYAEVETPARRACEEAVMAYQPEPLPHEESTTTFVNIFGDTTRLSTSDIGSAGTARLVASDPKWAETEHQDWIQAHREIAAAWDRRNVTLAEQAAARDAFEEDTRARFRMDAICDRSECLSDRQYKLWGAALTAPVGTLADVVAKLDFIDRTAGDDTGGDVFAAIRADVRLLAGDA